MDRTFPFWAGPFVGAVAGAWFGIKGVAGGRLPGIEAWMIVAGTALGGAFAGFLVALLDPRPKSGAFDEYDELPQREMSLVDRFILLLGVTFCWLPALGVGLAAATLVVTRGRSDWLRSLSYAAIVVTVLLHTAILVLWIVDP